MMEITINVPEWITYMVVIFLALWAVDLTLSLYKKYLEWKLRKFK